MSRGAVVIRINGDATSFKNELKKVEGETKVVSQSLAKVAAASTVGFGLLTAAIGASVVEFREGLKVSKAVEQTIKSTGGAAGVTAQDVDKLSLALQKVTNFGDETISTAQGILLTFTNLKKNVFPQVTELALDMAEKFGSAESAAEFLGKALNNPVKGMAALAKQGILFNTEQERTIRTLVETGRVAEAQAILLERLQSRFGGQARAAADPFVQLKEVLGDIVQVIGSVFNPVLEKMAIAMKSVAFYLLEVNPTLIKLGAYVIGATTAVLGLTAAVTIGIGVYLKATAIWAAYSASVGIAATASNVLALAIVGVGNAIRFLTGPIGIAVTVIAGLAAAVYAYSDQIVAFFAGLKASVTALLNDITNLTNPLKTIIDGVLAFDRERIEEGFNNLRDAWRQGGVSAALAFKEGYDQSIMESQLARPESPEAEFDKTASALNEAQTEYEIAADSAKKKLDLERQYREELQAIKDESDQLELEKEGFMNVERARLDLDEKKRRLQDQAKYGKFYADQAAFWRKEEVKGTTELFGELSTLTRSKNRELFAIGKAAAYANAVVHTAEGVTRALGAYIYPLNIALAAAVAAAGAVQIATISGTTLQAKEGFSGSGSIFGESMVSTFTPREIVVPERFSEGIKRGEFALTSSREQAQAQSQEVVVHVSMTDDAAEILEVKQIERRKLGISNG